MKTVNTYTKQQVIRRKAEDAIAFKFELRFFFEMVLSLIVVCFALFGIVNAIKDTPLDHTLWVSVLMLTAFGLMAAGLWKFLDLRQAELFNRAREAQREFRRAFGLEF